MYECESFTVLKLFLALLVAAALLLVAWSLVVPIFEAPDEPAHWAYARYIHDQHRLPPPGTLAQANYPPLYYLLIAPLATVSPLPSSLAATTAPPRLYANADDDLVRYWPLRLARLVGVFLSLVTIACCFLAGRAATGQSATGLLAAGLVAFLPQFTFRGMNICDDTLLMALSALITYLLIRIWRRGFSWPVAVGASIVVGGAILTKISALFFLLSLALALAKRAGSWRVRIGRLSCLGLTLALLAPWLLYNQRNVGDPLAVRAVRGAVAERSESHMLLSRYFLVDFPAHTLKSFIANFGWQNLGLPWWLYGVYGLVIAIAALGLINGYRRGALDLGIVGGLLLIAVLNLAVVITINLSYTAWQGRYLFPALAALGVLGALGLERLPRWTPQRGIAVCTALALLDAAILGAVVYPAYWPAS